MSPEFQKGWNRQFISDPCSISWDDGGWKVYFKMASSLTHMCGFMVLLGLSLLADGVSSIPHVAGAFHRVNRLYTGLQERKFQGLGNRNFQSLKAWAQHNQHSISITYYVISEAVRNPTQSQEERTQPLPLMGRVSKNVWPSLSTADNNLHVAAEYLLSFRIYVYKICFPLASVPVPVFINLQAKGERQFG